MESVVLALVVIIWIYIGYSFFSTNVYESFMPTDIEDRLGKVALEGRGPNTMLSSSNNPTNLMATYSSPILQSTAEATQHRYETALGNSKLNTGPRIDDTSSFLYMVDFCYNKANEANPFSDPTFNANCGICMTMGTTITGKGPDSNFGIVVYPEDKDFSRREGIEAVPSAHSATCAPIVKASGASSNVRSIAIDAEQFEATKAYKQLNSYAVTKGTGSTKSFACTGSSNNVPYVIKQGFSRVGEWDTKIGPDNINYSRVNKLDTTPFDETCIEKNSCTATGSGAQWDMSALCRFPKPTPITELSNVGRDSNSLTFRWVGGVYGTPEPKLLKMSTLTAAMGVPSGSLVTSTPLLGPDYVTYSNLIPLTHYKLRLRFSNAEGFSPDNDYREADGFTTA
jgi:hypothetical protein